LLLRTTVSKQPSILEALALLEDAVYRCTEESIDMPAIREALDILRKVQ
jgi:hypothetical protein